MSFALPNTASSKVSTTDALLDVTATLYNNINKSYHSALIMLDIKKASDARERFAEVLVSSLVTSH